jgi:hypothetical protein
MDDESQRGQLSNCPTRLRSNRVPSRQFGQRKRSSSPIPRTPQPTRILATDSRSVREDRAYAVNAMDRGHPRSAVARPRRGRAGGCTDRRLAAGSTRGKGGSVDRRGRDLEAPRKLGPFEPRSGWIARHAAGSARNGWRPNRRNSSRGGREESHDLRRRYRAPMARLPHQVVGADLPLTWRLRSTKLFRRLA